MRWIILTLVAFAVALQPSSAAASTTNPTATSIACDETLPDVGRLYQTLFGRDPHREGLAYWVRQHPSGLMAKHLARWMTRSAEYQQLHARSPICSMASERGWREVVPGIVVGHEGTTVTVLADRHLVAFDAVDGGPTYASSIPGDVVVNANWFTAAGSQAPVVSNGVRSGSHDIVERGQLISYRPECRGDGDRLDHIWMGEIYTPDHCVETAVSGVSLIHKGLRADAYPGITITTGYTSLNVSHSFIGFDRDKIVAIATRQMNAPQLADYALSLGVSEGIMLDGGGSTQIKTPTTGLSSPRAVTSFAVLNSLVD